MPHEIVVIGTSSGGLKALQRVLVKLPEDFPLPVVIVQHRSKDSDAGLCDFLCRYSALPVSEPNDKDWILEGHVYLAPSDYHLLITEGHFALSTDAPVAFARPSIDLLFESTADEYGTRAIGVILTGTNSDGARGLAKIKSRGGITIVEDPQEAAFPEMPQAATESSEVDWIVTLDEVGPLLNRLTTSTVSQYAN